jgi:hypothetical protein
VGERGSGVLARAAGPIYLYQPETAFNKSGYFKLIETANRPDPYRNINTLGDSHDAR